MESTALTVIPQPKEIDLTFVRMVQKNSNIVERNRRASEYSAKIYNQRREKERARENIIEPIKETVMDIAIAVTIAFAIVCIIIGSIYCCM